MVWLGLAFGAEYGKGWKIGIGIGIGLHSRYKDGYGLGRTLGYGLAWWTENGDFVYRRVRLDAKSGMVEKEGSGGKRMDIPWIFAVSLSLSRVVFWTAFWIPDMPCWFVCVCVFLRSFGGESAHVFA